jgi:hypothetical protein
VPAELRFVGALHRNAAGTAALVLFNRFYQPDIIS